MARNLVRRRQRTAVRRARRESAVARVATSPAAATVAARLEIERRLVRAVSDLDEPGRSAVVLRYHDGLGPTAIADRLGVPVRTVESRLRRALATLRDRLDVESDGDRRAWTLALLTIGPGGTALGGTVAAGGSGLTLGGIIVGAKLVIAGTIIALATAGALVWSVTREPETPPRRRSATTDVREPGAAPSVSEGQDVPRAVPPVVPQVRPEEYLRRINSGQEKALAVGREIASLSPSAAIAVLSAIFSQIEPSGRRLEAFQTPVHPRFLAVARLALADADPVVTNGALEALAVRFFRFFEGDRDAALAWVAEHDSRPNDVLLPECATEYMRRLGWLRGENLERATRQLSHLTAEAWVGTGIDLAVVLEGAGARERVDALLALPSEANRAKAGALGWVKHLPPARPWLTRVVLPVLEDPQATDPVVVQSAFEALGRKENGWAVEPLLRALVLVPPRNIGAYYRIAGVIARLEDALAIPTFIGMIAAHDDLTTIYGIGHFGLRPLTGVPYDKAHDAAWWRRWWIDNRGKSGPEVAGLEIPEVALPE